MLEWAINAEIFLEGVGDDDVVFVGQLIRGRVVVRPRLFMRILKNRNRLFLIPNVILLPRNKGLNKILTASGAVVVREKS